MDDSERDQLLTQATSAHQMGDLQQAEANYRTLWEDQQDDNLSYLLGTLLLQKGDAEQAIDFLAPIAARNLNSADLQNNLGVAYQAVGNPQQALLAFQAAVRADNSYPQVYHNIGKLLADARDYSNAEACYRQAVQLMPDDSQCREEWVQVLIQLEKWDDAARELNVMLHQDPDNTNLRTNIVFALAKLHQYDAAIEHCKKVLLIQPDSVKMLSNLSYLHEHCGQIEEAIAAAEKAFELAPQSAEIANNLGIAYRSAHKIEQAVTAFKKAIELNPEFSLAQFNLGSTQLLDQQYPAGWEHYEARQALMNSPSELESIPTWNGDPIPGRKLLLTCDQGFGDAIQFCRFLPRIKQVSQAEIILQAPPELLELFQGSFYHGEPLADQIISEAETLPTLDFHFPMTSVGAIFQLTMQDIEIDESYLQAPDNEQQNEQKESIKTIGLCWRGNPNQTQDHVRSMQLSSLQKLAHLEGIRWVSFQIDATPQELASWPAEIEDQGSKLKSFAETATALEQVDLLITVDTAMAHLAGAMQRPVWTMLVHTPDWRWHLKRTDSPWYPGMKLFRQPTWGDWDCVIEQVQTELQK